MSVIKLSQIFITKKCEKLAPYFHVTMLLYSYSSMHCMVTDIYNINNTNTKHREHKTIINNNKCKPMEFKVVL